MMSTHTLLLDVFLIVLLTHLSMNLKQVQVYREHGHLHWSPSPGLTTKSTTGSGLTAPLMKTRLDLSGTSMRSKLLLRTWNTTEITGALVSTCSWSQSIISWSFAVAQFPMKSWPRLPLLCSWNLETENSKDEKLSQCPPHLTTVLSSSFPALIIRNCCCIISLYFSHSAWSDSCRYCHSMSPEKALYAFCRLRRRLFGRCCLLKRHHQVSLIFVNYK